MNEKHFFETLEKKLHYTSEHTFTPNMSGSSFQVHHSNYTDNKLTADELEHALGYVKASPDLFFHPINTCSGFSVGYRISKGKKAARVVQFKEAQLPEGYTFEKLSETFMEEKNLKRAAKAGIEIENYYDKYDY